MPRITLDLNKEADRQKVKGQWRMGPGLVPGEPNEGLVAESWILPRVWPNYETPGGRFAKTFGRVSRKASFRLVPHDS